MTSFGKFLLRQQGRDDRVGDLATDFACDADHSHIFGEPLDVPTVTPDSLRRRLEKSGACQGALEALSDVEKEWLAEKTTNPKEREPK